MKKAKLMLAVIAVFAVVGGAYAFKAKNDTFHVFVRANGVTTCGLQLKTRTLEPGLATISTSFVTTIAGPCTSSQPYYSAE